MNPNWDPETMPDWNKTTECEPWDEDYVPCRFPYTGLTGYGGAGEKHCYDTFAQASPGTSWVISETLSVTASLLLVLMYTYRHLFYLIDKGRVTVPESIKNRFSIFSDLNDYKRKFGRGNQYDECNMLSNAIAWMQLLRAIDVNAWADRLGPSTYHSLGALSHCIGITQAQMFIVMWMKLVHVWSDPLKNNTTEPPGIIWYRRIINCLIWLINCPLSIFTNFRVKICEYDRGCVSGKWSCVARSSFSICCVVMAVASLYNFRLIVIALMKKEKRVRMSRSTISDVSLGLLGRNSDPVEVKRVSSSRVQTIIDVNDDDTDELVWIQILKILKIVLLLLLVGAYVVILNAQYCFQRSGEIEYYSPGCQFSDVFANQPAYWILNVWLAGLLFAIPARQKADDKLKRAIVNRILGIV